MIRQSLAAAVRLARFCLQWILAIAVVFAALAKRCIIANKQGGIKLAPLAFLFLNLYEQLYEYGVP